MAMMKILLLSTALIAIGDAFSLSSKTVRPSTQLFSTPENSLDRRAFIWSGVAASLAMTTSPLPSVAAGVDYKAVASDLSDLIKKNPDWGPTLVRLAWHSSGTYDKMSKTGGSGGGTIRFKEELAHGGNAGLAETAVEWMEPVHEKYADAGLSYADLYTLAGGAIFIELLLFVRLLLSNTSIASLLQSRPLKPWVDRPFPGAVVVLTKWIPR